jgi:hypothetical protein
MIESTGDKVAFMIAWKLEHDRYHRNLARAQEYALELLMLAIQKRKLTKIGISLRLHCSQNRVNDYLNGKPMSPVHMARLAEVLDVAAIRNLT